MRELGRESVFSEEAGRLCWEVLKGREWRWMLGLGWGEEDWRCLMLRGVVMIVMESVGCLCEMRLAKAAKGRRWPWAMKGSITMWCLIWLLAIVGVVCSD